MTHSSVLSLHNVTYQVGQQKLIDCISFDLAPGEFLTIVGPNGAGKTTLLKLIIGLLKPSAGDIRIAPNTKIGYMPQKLMLDYMLPLTVQGFLTRPNRKELVGNVIQSLGIHGLLAKSMHHLSGGELQRVILARALLNQPNVLILDEPSQGVDIKGQNELFNLIAHLREMMKFAVLMVSHDLYVVHKSSDRVLCLNQHICCMGRPDVIRQSKEYQAMFPDHLLNQISTYTHHHDHRHDQLENPKKLHDE